MNPSLSRPPLPAAIHGLLQRLRRNIRGYVWGQGLAHVVIGLGICYWLSVTLDYLPVRMGASELPVAARFWLLMATGIILVTIAFRSILRRACVPLRDPSLALLIERHHPEFRDSLVTAVERPADAELQPLERQLVSQAVQQAAGQTGQVQLQRIFDYRPWRRAMAGAAVVLLSWGLAAWLAGPGFSLSLRRLYGLADLPYPRQTHLEMVGFDSEIVVARGSDVTLRVAADATRPVPPPAVCSIHYLTNGGERGRVHMSRQGQPRNGRQLYVFGDKPFKSILDDIQFDVVGNDQRLRQRRIRVVDSPQIVRVQLECERPAYTGLAPVTLEYYPGISVPRGSRVTVRLTANKPLREATLQPTAVAGQAAARQLLPPTSAGQAASATTSFSFDIASLDEDEHQEILLRDTDGIESAQPYRLHIAAAADKPPAVDVRLVGIGTAITPVARLPVVGQVRDDYGVERTWFALELPDGQQFEVDIQLPAHGALDQALDLREERTRNDPLQLPVDARLALTVKSRDAYDLEPSDRHGSSDRYELEVVTPSRLIALLEARELGLRRRFEQIVQEMQESRDNLSQLPFPPDEPALEPSESATASPQTSLERQFSTRQVGIQRAMQHSSRAAQEVLGVALSFEDIRQELANNRVDADDRRDRLKREIADPLRDIAERLFPLWDQRLDALQRALDRRDPQNLYLPYVAAAATQADEILLAMEAVLAKMLDLESYNELVDLLRDLIRDQEDVTEKTKSQQKQSALELLK